MKRAGLALLALAMAACSPPNAQKSEETTADAETTVPVQRGCNAQASRDWSAVGSQYYVIEAEAHGDTCQTATATMRIKSRDGAVLYERSFQTSQVSLAFAPTSDQTALREELEAWTENTAETPTADWLPAWPLRAANPPGFTPAVSRGQYEAARGAQGPLFCFPDGGESNACVALQGDHATFLGSLTPER
jgi:hypothetical protein